MTHIAGLVFLIGSLLVIPLYRGGNADWPPALLGLSAALSVLMACISTPSASPRKINVSRGATITVLIWLAWLAWQGLQIMPLPAELLHAISPFSYAIHHAVTNVGGSPIYRLSTAPLESARLLQWSLAYFTLYIAVLWNVRSRHDIGIILIAMAVLATLEAVYGALHEVVGFSIGWLDPVGAHRHGATGTFPNRNHYAAYLVLGTVPLLSLLLSWRGQTRQTLRGKFLNFLDFLSSPVILYRMMLITLIVGVILSRSRMGNTSLAIGFTVLATIWLLKTRKSSSFIKGLLLFTSIAVIDIALISERFGIERVLTRIESTDLSTENRTTANQMSKELLQLTWPQGAGMGSYRYLQEGVRPVGSRQIFDYAHNDFLQFSIEAGAIGSVLLAALLAWHALLALLNLGRKRSIYRAYSASFVMIVVAALTHASVEFNFYIPAYAATFVVLMALMQTIHSSRRRVT